MYKSTRMDEYIETLYYHLPNKVDVNNIQQEKDLISGKNKTKVVHKNVSQGYYKVKLYIINNFYLGYVSIQYQILMRLDIKQVTFSDLQ